MTNVKSLLEMYVKMGGSLTDTYSDIAGGVPVGQYSTISDAILACSKKYSAGGGGGAEKFIVNIRDSGGTTSDKKIAKIVAAKEAGKDVVANVYIGMFGVTAEIPLIYAFTAPEGQGYAVIFSAPVPNMGESIGENIYTVYGIVQSGSDDVWNSDMVAVGGSTNAPLIVTLTVDESTGNLVGNKTYKEVYDAFSDGRSVLAKCVVGSTYVSASVLAANETSGEYSLNVCVRGSIVVPEGTATDYLTLHLGN